MQISHAFDRFEAALKAMRAAEIAALGAVGPLKRRAAQDVVAAIEQVREAAVRLWSLPARGPSDLVLKARALRWHFPEGVQIDEPARFGAETPDDSAPLGAIAMHYLVKDLLALSE